MLIPERENLTAEVDLVCSNSPEIFSQCENISFVFRTLRQRLFWCGRHRRSKQSFIVICFRIIPVHCKSDFLPHHLSKTGKFRPKSFYQSNFRSIVQANNFLAVPHFFLKNSNKREIKKIHSDHRTETTINIKVRRTISFRHQYRLR